MPTGSLGGIHDLGRNADVTQKLTSVTHSLPRKQLKKKKKKKKKKSLVVPGHRRFLMTRKAENLGFTEEEEIKNLTEGFKKN